MAKIKIIWSYIKKYWQIVVALLLFIVLLVIFRKQAFSLTDRFKKINKLHKDELDIIKEEREKKNAEKEKIVINSIKERDDIIIDYEKRREELRKLREEERKKLLSKSQDELTDELSKVLDYEKVD